MTELDNQANIYRLTINKWDRYNIDTDHDFVKLVRQTILIFDGDGDHVDTTVEYTYDNVTGNVLIKNDYGKVVANTDGSYVDVDNDTRITNYTYAINGSTNVTVPSSVTVTDSLLNKISEQKYYYDNLLFGNVTKGNQTKVEKWKSDTTYLNAKKTYNNLGLVISETDPRGKVISYYYDPYNLYPIIVLNPLNQTTVYVYDYSSGKVKNYSDQNGRLFEIVYDEFDRVVEEKQPDLANPSISVSKTHYVYDDTPGNVSVHEINHLDGANSFDVYKYYDGFGRLIQIRKETENGEMFATSDAGYNYFSGIYKESLPYLSSGSSKTPPNYNSILMTTYTYDPMKRVKTSVNSVGTMTYAYDDLKTTVTDPKGNIKNYYKDVWGNLVKVEEINGGNTYTTEYQYNKSNNLIKITDALGNVRNFTYDALGRRLTAEDLHAPTDTTFGKWTYAYDENGNLNYVIDPKNQLIRYNYDSINRVAEENYMATPSADIRYFYDSGVNGVGRLTSIQSTGANTSYSYDPVGNIKQESVTISSKTFQTNYTYDKQDNILVITNPDNSQVKYTYNTAGQLEVVGFQDVKGEISLVTDFNYGPHGKVIHQVFPNGVVTNNEYDETKMYQLNKKITTTSGGIKLQDLDYDYDANGNIIKIIDQSDTSASKTVDYIYDNLNRLTSVSSTDYTQNYTYNSIGNIVSGSLGSFVYAGNIGTNYANPHAVTSVGSVNYIYDKNGNFLKTNGLSNSWDYNNRLISSYKNNITTNYSYDYTGNRVYLSNKFGTTYYPTNYYNIYNDPKVADSTKKTKHIFGGGELIATVETTYERDEFNHLITIITPYYIHTDHLGSTNTVSSNSGSLVETLDYYPYGNPRISSGSHTEQRQYIGEEYDEYTDLNYLNARYYDSFKGRFISQDPMFWRFDQAWLLDPQNQNSYSYARGNPINNSDPTGLYNVKTGVVEKGDTKSNIVNSINKAFGIKTDWNTVKDVSFYNDRFGNQSLEDIVGQNLYIGTNITTNITDQLNGLNQSRATVANLLGKGSLGLFAPKMPWDIKNSSDLILGGGTNRQYMSYVYNGELVRYDAPGNINFGYTARAAGLNGSTIQFGAQLQQGVDDYLRGQNFSLKDNGGDSTYVQKGIDSYNSQQSWWQKLLGW